MARSNANLGTIVVGGFKPHDNGMVACRVIEIRISRNQAFLTLGSNPLLMDGAGTIRSVRGYQHLTIPADLEIHLTPSSRDRSKRLFFDPPLTDRGLNRVSLVNRAALVFTYVSQPVARCPLLTRFHRKRGGIIMIMTPDDPYDPSRTRCFLDFFVHRRTDEAYERVRNAPLVLDSMRLPLGGHSVQGPFEYRLAVPGSKRETDFGFSVRTGYYEAGSENNSLLLIPRRARPPRIRAGV